MAEERQDIGIGGEEEGLLDRFCKGERGSAVTSTSRCAISLRAVSVLKINKKEKIII